MAEIINLRLARKAKARAQATGDADAKRAVHGRTKAERAHDEADKTRLERTLDQAKRED
jgi:Domain of unknown function (DUF4169)